MLTLVIFAFGRFAAAERKGGATTTPADPAASVFRKSRRSKLCCSRERPRGTSGVRDMEGSLRKVVDGERLHQGRLTSHGLRPTQEGLRHAAWVERKSRMRRT